jgi:hypothetical protein
MTTNVLGAPSSFFLNATEQSKPRMASRAQVLQRLRSICTNAEASSRFWESLPTDVLQTMIVVLDNGGFRKIVDTQDQEAAEAGGRLGPCYAIERVFEYISRNPVSPRHPVTDRVFSETVLLGVLMAYTQFVRMQNPTLKDVHVKMQVCQKVYHHMALGLGFDPSQIVFDAHFDAVVNLFDNSGWASGAHQAFKTAIIVDLIRDFRERGPHDIMEMPNACPIS